MLGKNIEKDASDANRRNRNAAGGSQTSAGKRGRTASQKNSQAAAESKS